MTFLLLPLCQTTMQSQAVSQGMLHISVVDGQSCNNSASFGNIALDHAVQEDDVSKAEHERHLQEIVTFVEQHLGAMLVDKLETQLQFKVPTDCESQLSAFFKQIKVCNRTSSCLARSDQ